MSSLQLPPITRWHAVSTVALCAVVVGILIQATVKLPLAGTVASAGLIAYWLMEAARTNRIGQAILAAGGVFSLAVVAVKEAPAAILLHALAEASFGVGLLMALGFLREAAETSPLVHACGEQMVRQPPGRRYAVLTLGSHVIAIVLNFGVMTLLGVMVNKGNSLESAGGDTALRAYRQRTMMMAILRGFALMTAWSPLSIVFAIAQSILPGVPWWGLVPWQILITAILLGFGALLDWRKRYPGEMEGMTASAPLEAASGNPLLRLSGLIVAVVAVSVLVAEFLGVRIVVGAMLTVPVSAWVWLIAQKIRRVPNAPLAAARHLIAKMVRSFPASRNEVALIGGSMYAGIVGASLLPADAVGQAVAASGLPPVAIAVILAWGMMILAQFGISQIVTMAFISGAVPILAGLGLDPVVVMSGLMASWALSIATTPVGAGILLIARLSDVPVNTIIREWNAAFVVGGALLVALWMILLSFIVPL